MHRFRAMALLAGLLLVAGTARAHYPWFVPTKDPTKIDLYFEEGPRPGDGEYLPSFLKGKFWLRTPGQEPTPIKFEEVNKGGQRFLTFTTEAKPPRALEGYCKYGVYKGNLLFYYFKHLDAQAAKNLKPLARAEQLDYDLVPSWADGSLEVQLLWKGKPKGNQAVAVIGPKFREQIRSDDSGIVRFKPPASGLYTLRTSFVDAEPAGKDDGNDYKGLRQTATLTINLPVE
ncbi:MAG: hypothetical protein AB7K24_30785 [Gemmataceae bacterium]